MERMYLGGRYGFSRYNYQKDGKWYYDTAEMFRRNILNILARNIERMEDGNYCIKIGQK